jgi:enamine deaminase RidA (YjgF/YER057c/UK114 family)
MPNAVEYRNAPGLAKPPGMYSHISRFKASELVLVAGQLAVSETGELIGKNDFKAQTRAVFDNLARALNAEGLGFEHVVKFTTFLVHSQDIESFMAVRGELFSRLYPSGQYPPNTLLVVDRLVGEHFLIEIESIAAVP